MKHIFLLVFLLLALVPVASAQDEVTVCNTDMTAVRALLDQVESAASDEEAFDLMNEARLLLIQQQLDCAGLPVDDVIGSTRATPTPFGTADTVTIESFSGVSFEGTARILGTSVLTDDQIIEFNMFNDPTPAGQQYVTVDIELTCAASFVSACEVDRIDWNAVGDLGRVYEWNYDVTSVPGTDDFELFGGGTGTLTLVFLIPLDDGNLIVYPDTDNPTFFATQE